MNCEDIEKSVSDLLMKCKYDESEGPIDVVKLAKSIGFSVVNVKFKDDMDGFVIIDERKGQILGIQTQKLIGVNADRSLEWKRFIVAHEIGHSILHYSEEKDRGMYAHRDHARGKNEIENEADFFAANLILPREKFSKEFEELKEKNLPLDEIVLLLSRRFIATQKTVERRIGELKLEA